MKQRSTWWCVTALVIILFGVTGCSKHQEKTGPASTDFQVLADSLTLWERNDRLKECSSVYDAKALSLPEYQLTLTGINAIESFYKEIVRRQKIKRSQQKLEEVINLTRTVVEIGTFRNEYCPLNRADTTVSQAGQYWHVWRLQADNRYKITGEALGFFHSVAHPEDFTIPVKNEQPDESQVWQQKDIPFELKAYNALMEKAFECVMAFSVRNFLCATAASSHTPIHLFRASKK